jgi:hypothetical protein
MSPLKQGRSTTAHSSALLGFALLTILMTWPLVTQLGESVPGWPGDNLLYVWMLSWFKRAVLDLGVSPAFSPLFFAPEGLELARTEMTLANTVLGLPMTAAWGPVVSYNLMLLLSYVLSGFGAYLWIWRLSGDHLAGFIAGITLAFAPYRTAHLPGHLPLMATQWLPFLFFSLEELGRTRRLRFAALCGLFLALNAWASWYYFFVSLVAVPVYVLIRFGNWRARLRRAFFWQAACVSLAPAALLIGAASWPFLQFHGTGEMQHAFSTMESWSASPTDFFVPNLLHPLWGDALRELVPHQTRLLVEKNLSLGVIPLGLGLVAIFGRWKDRAVRALTSMALVSLVLALGPSLQWAGERVVVSVPTRVVGYLERMGVTPYLASRIDSVIPNTAQLNPQILVPLPMLLFYLFVPFTASMRAIGRFGMITTLAVAGLAGLGIAFLRLRGRGRLWRWIIPLVAMGVILFEFWAIPWRATALQPRPIDLWLAEQEPGAVVELPIDEGLHPLRQYDTMVSQQASLLAPMSLPFLPDAFAERVARLGSFPDEMSLDALAEYQVAYILVHTIEYEGLSRELRENAAQRLHLIRCFDSICAYSLEPLK